MAPAERKGAAIAAWTSGPGIGWTHRSPSDSERPAMASTGSLPLWFLWIAVPAYLIWGLGLGAAALAYRHATRPRCRTCGR